MLGAAGVPEAIKEIVKAEALETLKVQMIVTTRAKTNGFIRLHHKPLSFKFICMCQNAPASR